jgi:hypothetical protein
MLEDRERNVVYVPISKELLPKLKEWSEPVRFRVETTRHGAGRTELSLVFERLELTPIELTKGRGA